MVKRIAQSFFCEKALQEIEEKRMLPFTPRVYDFLCRDRNTGEVFCCGRRENGTERISVRIMSA